MKKYMAVYVADRAEIDKFMSRPLDERQEDMKEDLEKWGKWMKDHNDALADSGSMFGKTKRVTAKGASDAKNELTGYTILEAESYDDAVKLFGDHPYLKFPGSSVEVMECLSMDGR